VTTNRRPDLRARRLVGTVVGRSVQSFQKKKMALDSVLCIMTCQETEATGKNLSYSVGQINKKWEEKEYGRPRADEYKEDELPER